MAFADIRTHIHLDATYTVAEKRQILVSIKHAYLNSPSAQAMFDRLLTVEPDVTINNANKFNANVNTNILNIGMHYLDNLYMINSHGAAVRYNFEVALLHEFSHALNNILDPTDAQLAAHDYVGDNVRFENIMRAELGAAPRTTYYNIMRDAIYEEHQPASRKGYTNGNEIDQAVVSSSKFINIDTTGQGSSRDLLIGVRAEDNELLSGDGRDYIYGFKGNDKLDGGGGTDYLFGGDDNDILIGGGGNNLLDGGAGKDLAELTGFKFMQTVTVSGGTRTLVDQGTGDKNVLRGIETTRFTASGAPLPVEITSTFVASAGTALAPNDDSFSSASLAAAFEKGLNFFGTKYTEVFVNNNGSLTFGNGLSSFTPGSIGGDSGLPIIAAFWADVDTRNGGGTVSYGYNSAHDSFVATWSNVDYYNTNSVGHVSRSNSYQIEIFDQGGGDAEIIIRYGDLNWTTGDASGGSGGLGGTVARAGVNSGNATFQFEMPGSGNQEAMLALDTSSNCDRAGVWRFSVHNGTIIEDELVFNSHHQQTEPDWAFV